MLTSEQVSAYFENGYLLVEDVVTPEQLQRMQNITHEFIDRSRQVTASNDVYELDEGHNSKTPKLTWIKLPHKQYPFFWDVVKNSGITEVLRQLVGPNAVFANIQAQRKGAGRRGCCGVAPGLGILSAYQRRHVGLRCLFGRRHGGKWTALGHSGISQRPGFGSQ